jgi:hypothetical protein
MTDMTMMTSTRLQDPIAPPPPETSAMPPGSGTQSGTQTGTPGTPGSRGTSFVPVEGGSTEQHSGATLLIEAYAVLWIILMTWLFMLWRKQSSLHAKLDDLERVLDRAAAAAAAAQKK